MLRRVGAWLQTNFIRGSEKPYSVCFLSEEALQWTLRCTTFVCNGRNQRYYFWFSISFSFLVRKHGFVSFYHSNYGSLSSAGHWIITGAIFLFLLWIGALVMADSILLQSKYTDPKTLLLDFLSLVILLLLIIETPFKYPCKAT